MLRLAYIGMIVALAGCGATAPIKPIASASDLSEISIKESRLWGQSVDFDEQLQRSDRLYSDRELNRYLQSVMDKLYPELAGVIKVRALKSPLLNAFALPNGSVYVNIGLLARMENEAQLATVLGHEGAHFVYKHGIQNRQELQSASNLGLLLTVAGLPIIGDLFAYSSAFGFSRDLEREADRVAFERLKTTKYNLADSTKVFEQLANEAEALGAEAPYFFASHPKLQERVENFKVLIESEPSHDGRIGQKTFNHYTKAMRLNCLKEDRAAGRYASLIAYLEQPETEKRYPGAVRHYFLAEAYRMRNEDGDSQHSLNEYKASIATNKRYASSYRGLGILFMKSDRPKDAIHYLDRYLKLASNAPDRAYIEEYLKELKERTINK